MNDTAKVWLGLSIIILFALFFWPGTSQYDGQGEISMFPQSADAKNYRLEADISVTSHNKGLLRHHYEYNVSRAYWPNGGYSEFTNCVVEQGYRVDCTDQDGHAYTIEVTTAPDPPESDYSDN